MRHKIFNYIKTYQGYIFNVSGGSFFKGQNKFPRKPASLIYRVGLNTSFEVFFGFFCQSYRKTNKHEQTWWIEIGKDNRKDDDELTAGDRKIRSCYFCFWDRNWIESYPCVTSVEGLLTLLCIRQAGIFIFIGFGLLFLLSSHKHPLNIQKKN